MKIALAQMNYTVGDFEANKIKIIDCIQQAKMQEVDLVVFSEQAISGTPAYDLLNKVSFWISAKSLWSKLPHVATTFRYWWVCHAKTRITRRSVWQH